VGTHTFRVRATDALGNSDIAPPTYTWAISAAALLSSLGDTTLADFSAGTPDAGISVGRAADGKVSLAPTLIADFANGTVPGNWVSTPFTGGGSVTFSNGAANVSGSIIATSTYYNAGRSLEFVATFRGSPYQHIGFGIDFNTGPWAIFTTYDGTALYARTRNDTKSNSTLIAGNWFDAPHRFRIDWGAGSVSYSIDGSLVATHAVAITSVMRPAVSSYVVDSRILAVNWLRMSPYAASGTFLSRVFDAGGVANWGAPTWNAAAPSGTSLQMSVRLGNTAVPDSSWTAFTPLAASGTAVSGNARYFQYRALLATTDPDRTPALDAFSLAPMISVSDTTAADFNAGTAGAGISITNVVDGELALAPSALLDFSVPSLPSGASTKIYATGGGVSFSDGYAKVDGAFVTIGSFSGPGHTLEFVANFNGVAYQHVGYGLTLESSSWAIFSTGDGGALYARSNGPIGINTLIPGNWLGSTHRYRIDWNQSSIVYFIDGAVVATHSMEITQQMRPVIADYFVDGKTLAIASLRMSPYVSSGQFLSRVIGGGNSRSWNNVTWTGNTPAGTSIVVSVRLGDTPAPDGTWTAFTPVTSGAAIPGSSKYLQYRVSLATTDPTQTPVFSDITFR
jgi:hypothetical protein